MSRPTPFSVLAFSRTHTPHRSPSSNGAGAGNSCQEQTGELALCRQNVLQKEEELRNVDFGRKGAGCQKATDLSYKHSLKWFLGKRRMSELGHFGAYTISEITLRSTFLVSLHIIFSFYSSNSFLLKERHKAPKTRVSSNLFANTLLLIMLRIIQIECHALLSSSFFFFFLALS